MVSSYLGISVPKSIGELLIWLRAKALATGTSLCVCVCSATPYVWVFMHCSSC